MTSTTDSVVSPSLWSPDEHLEALYISISGLIGAGKSTLATALGKTMSLPVYHEPVISNTYLADFYKDQRRYSFPLQVWLLNRRFKQQQQIIWQGQGAVQDRTIYEDTVFAKMLRDAGLMDKRDYETYASLFGNLSNFMRKPNLIVHLDVSPEESMRRIKMRARDCEVGITLDYLRALHAAYESFVADISRVIPVIRVDYARFHSAEEMAEMIKREYVRLTNVRRVTVGPDDKLSRSLRDDHDDALANAAGANASANNADPASAASSPAKPSSASASTSAAPSPAKA